MPSSNMGVPFNKFVRSRPTLQKKGQRQVLMTVGFKREVGLKASPKASAAVISGDGKYRYMLSRHWTQGSARAVWIMLNPSTADAAKDDATIRRCICFAKRWGYDGIEVYNLFALRSRHPTRIEMVEDPVGPDNDRWLRTAAQNKGKVIAAWGACNTPLQLKRANEVIELLVRDQHVSLCALGFTKDGHPRHPLYVRNDVMLSPLVCPSRV